MKKQIDKLNKLIKSKEIAVNDFYCITVFCDEIRLQGWIKNVKIPDYEKSGYVRYMEHPIYYQLRKDNVIITLT